MLVIQTLERARLIYGKDLADNLIEFKEELPDFKLSGLLGKPDFTKANREYQLFFMNQRPIRSQMIGAALKEALGATIQKDRHAVALLFLTLEPDTVDVNVHPAKIEVRFRNERTIFSGIVRMIHNVIHKEKFIPKIETSSIETSQEGKVENTTIGTTRAFSTSQHRTQPVIPARESVDATETTQLDECANGKS